MKKRYVGRLIRVPEQGYPDTWRGTLGKAAAPASVLSSKRVEEVIEWFDAQVGTRVMFEETLSSQMGFRAFVEE